MILGGVAIAAPYADFVIDARTGEVLHESNADTRLHPASLTKMMTLYLAFQAVESGQISLDTKVTISKHAASQPPSKLGLRPGQKIQLRYLIRAAAVKSANDAATAIGEALAGSESAFAERMTATARKMGMSNTTFKNANGLTRSGHVSTARDMTTLGRRLFFDFPDYYNLFSRRTTDAGVKSVYNTNRRFLEAYKGADGIKTGYTNAAGFNLVASAQRGQERIIATVFGGRSTAARNARVAELLDLGFKRAPTRVAVVKPKPLSITNPVGGGEVLRNDEPLALASSVIPTRRRQPDPQPVLMAGVDQSAIDNAVFAAVRDSGTQTVIVPQKRPEDLVETVAATDPEPAQVQPAPTQTAEAEPVVEQPAVVQVAEAQPAVVQAAVAQPAAAQPAVAKPPVAEPVLVARAAQEQLVPVSLNTSEATEAAILAAIRATPAEEEEPEPRVIVRDTNDPRKWSVQVGAYRTRYQAEKQLLRTALADLKALDGALRKIDSDVVRGERFYRARFVGLSEDAAHNACVRLIARNEACVPIGPGN